MSEDKPTYADHKAMLRRGCHVTLPDGQEGVFLQLGKGGVNSWVLVGDADGPKKTVPTEAMIMATWKVAKK